MLIPFGFYGAGVTKADFELISSTFVTGSSTASVNFDVSTLASTYKHLQLRAVFRSGINVAGDNISLRFNGVTTYTSYSSHYLYGNGTATSSAFLQTASYTGIVSSINSADGSSPANVFSPVIIDILDAFSTSKNKTTRSLSGNSTAGSGNQGVTLSSGAWLSTSAVTSVTLLPYQGTSPYIASGSRVSLYGIKG